MESRCLQCVEMIVVDVGGPQSHRHSIIRGFVASQRGRVGKREGRKCNRRDCDARRRPLWLGQWGVLSAHWRLQAVGFYTLVKPFKDG